MYIIQNGYGPCRCALCMMVANVRGATAALRTRSGGGGKYIALVVGELDEKRG